eukprot:scaffold14535_cov198-Skeletonema_marinoi.AAC.4
MESLKQRWDEWVISLKSKKGGASGGNIKSAQIVYVFGPPGTGKVCRFTFSFICLVRWPTPPAKKAPKPPRVEEKEAPRAQKKIPTITPDEAKDSATLKSDTIK